MLIFQNSKLNMKKHKENMFNEKFRLLISQGSTEEINWSSSDSNEFENVPSNVETKICNITHKNRKRKRKKKGAVNISNLNITYVNPSNDKEEFGNKACQESCKYPEQTSPILCTSQYFPKYKRKVIPSSPILLTTVKEAQPKEKKSLKSPILVLKTASPKVSPKVKKKLFDLPSQIIDKHTHTLQNRSKSSHACLDRRKSDNYQLCDIKSLKLRNDTDFMKTNLQERSVSAINNDKSKLHSQSLFINDVDMNNVKQEVDEDFDINCTIQETPDAISNDDSMVMLKTSSADLANKVKSYFDSHFSSDSASQLTISEVQTPKSCSKTSDDIEIISTITQMPSNRNSAECESEHEEVNRKGKKLRYKKDGLAYRLNSLLKKQTASISLWQHERFLASNSNFVIPKCEFKAFRICKIQFNYGAYLLETLDVNEDNYLILINKTYISHDNVKQQSFFKLYEPYRVMDYRNNCKLIINVCKFEFVEASS